MHSPLLTLALLSLLCCSAFSGSSGSAKSPKGGDNSGSKLQAYQAALDTVADNINKATEKSEALISKHMAAVDKDPGSLITKEAMQKLMQSSSFLPQKAGTRSIMVEAQQGFNGISNYQPSSWKITESMSGPTDKKSEPASNFNPPVYTYPSGVGPVLLNGCTAGKYNNTSPCYNSKLLNIQNTVCLHLMDAANYIGVGFDGRGYYRAESRRASLIQRVCTHKTKFLGQDIPDTMNVFGIFETTAETKSFQSVDEYMSYIRSMAGLSEQKNLFISEASKFSKASSFGANMGGIGSIIGGAIGAVAGGPVGAAMGATLGGAIGGSIGGGRGSGSGSESATDKGQSSSNVNQVDQAAKQQTSSQSFFAIMYVNVVLYEISLDDVKPTDINLAALKDFMSLPVSYYSAGAEVKYQTFLLRWGTHFIRSGKFGGQLKITKTAKTDKVQSENEFASIAETEFQSMFSTLQSKYSQESSSWSFLGLGGESKQASQSSSAKSESGYTGTSNAQNKQSQAFRQSEFTQTTVEAQGGTAEIAEALVDFYTPAFKQLFHQWIVSIKDYAKPFEFQLRPINELFNLNMESLFPAGNLDFGCVGDGSGKVKILIEPQTKMRYYIDNQTAFYNNVTVEKKVRVNCRYRSISDFKQDMERRMMSLEKAVGVYMAEGPFPTSSFELQGGQPGCEEATVALFHLFGNSSLPLKFAELLRQPFIIAFNLPESVPDVVTMQAKYVMVYRFDRWFAVDPSQELVNLYDGCQIANLKSANQKVCFRNIILTYEESTGLFHINVADFAASKTRIPSLPYWLAGTTVARARRMFLPSSGGPLDVTKKPERPAIPCNVKWLNSHRLDPSKSDNCIHFTAASEGDLFVIFASVPRDHTTWYYLQISPEGVSFFQAMSLQKSDQKKGMGMLGDKNLYESFFVCVIQKSGTVTMQYGKADPDSDVGTVFSAYTFPPDSKFSRLSFYSFGAGTKPISLMDVRQTRNMPVVACLGNDYVKKDGKCMLDCHVECDGCRQARDIRECQQCKNMRVETGSGGTTVTECVVQCPAGMYQSDLSHGLCIPCAAGTFKSTAGNQKCSSCPKGSSSAEGATRCAGCPGGTYSDNSGSQRCEKCPAGKYAASGAKGCSNCAAGSFSEVGQAQCNPCPYGHYGSSVGMPVCEACAVGYFANRRGMTACTRCPAGSTSLRGSRTCVNSCQLGEFSPRIGVACKKCPPGNFAESRGSTTCSLCRIGFYQPNSGGSRCIAAPKGSYVPDRGANTFRACSAGTFNNLEGQSSFTACRSCPAGTYTSSSGSVACAKCPVGQYQPSVGQTGCIAASPGYYTNAEGSANHVACPPGHFTSQRGSTGCSACGIGHYAPSGSSACSKCTEFQYSRAGAGACTNCPSNALVKSDLVNCYRKVPFNLCSAGGAYTSAYSCNKAMDGIRGWEPYISQQSGTKIWQGHLSVTSHIRKIVLWKRPCCPNEFIGIKVIAMVPGRIPPYVVCGRVTVNQRDRTYVVFDCNAPAVPVIILTRDTDRGYPVFSINEVEVYVD